MKIAHISDIHFRGSQRHEEYRIVCKQLFYSLKVKKPDLVVCTGDIFHTKTSGLTPEIIDLLCWFFKELASKYKLVMILGNHDGNLTNLSRQDSISPIIDAINSPNIKLLKQSQAYWFDDTTLFHAYSCFDKEHWHLLDEEIKSLNTENITTIALFHGSVAGCTMDNGMISDHGEIDLKFFDHYDIGLLGDIHKRQGFRTNKRAMQTIAYPGSLIQQNFGEELEKGYLLWEIKDKQVEFVEFVSLLNPFPFVSVMWNGDIINLTAKIIETGKITNLKGVRVRVLFKPGQLNANDKRVINKELCETFGIDGPVVFKPITVKTTNNNSLTKTQTISQLQEKILENQDGFSSLNVRDPEVIFDLFKKTAKIEQFVDDKKIKEFINYCMTESGIEQTHSKTNSFWRLKELHFDNLFRYGEGNKINFDKLNGVTGIFGDNKIGKSSIIGTIMFGLFNATDRGPARTAHVINKNASKGSCSMIINVNGTDYFIERTATKLKGRGGVLDEEKAVTNLNIFKLIDGKKAENIVGQTEDSKTDTDKFLRNLIGSADDFLLTALSSQGNINAFIDKGSTERKAVLNRFLGFDVFEKMFKPASEKKNALLARLNKRSSTLLKKEIEDLNNSIIEQKNNFEKEKEKLTFVFDKQKTVITWLNENKKVLDNRKEYYNFLGLINEKEKQIQEKTKIIDFFEKEIKYITSLINEQKEKISKFPTDNELTEHTDKLSKIEKEIATQQATQKLTTNIETSQVKNIKKLELVPCGDKFPTCHFIKDAHEDQKKINSTREALQSLTDELNKLYSLHSALVAYGGVAILNEKKAAEKNLNNLQTKLTSLEYSLEKEKQTKQIIFEKLEWLKNEVGKYSIEEIEKLQESLPVQEKELLFYEKEIKAIQKTIEEQTFNLGFAEARKTKLLTEIEEVSSLENECLIAELMSSAFSKTGIPGIILAEQLPKINSELEKISSEVSDFRLSLQPDNKSNALNIVIDDSNGQRLVDLGSGAEKMIASLALRIALYNLSILPKPDMFIIDESFGVLDDKNRPKLVGLLQSFKSMFKNVLIISHIQDVKEAADNLLEIEANEFSSKICAI